MADEIKIPSRDNLLRLSKALVKDIDDSKADKATTLAGYGITDAYTKAQADKMHNVVVVTYSSDFTTCSHTHAEIIAAAQSGKIILASWNGYTATPLYAGDPFMFQIHAIEGTTTVGITITHNSDDTISMEEDSLEIMPKSGGTFTGAVTLQGDPTENLQPATKQYVDSKEMFFVVRYKINSEDSQDMDCDCLFEDMLNARNAGKALLAIMTDETDIEYYSIKCDWYGDEVFWEFTVLGSTSSGYCSIHHMDSEAMNYAYGLTETPLIVTYTANSTDNSLSSSHSYTSVLNAINLGRSVIAKLVLPDTVVLLNNIDLSESPTIWFVFDGGYTIYDVAISNDGSAVYTMSNRNYVTKSYVDNQIGDIETILNSIIA